MCARCDQLPEQMRDLLAAMFVTGTRYVAAAEAGEDDQANSIMDRFLTRVLDELTPEGVQAMMGTLILMSMEELHPFYHHARDRYAKTN